MVRLMIGRDLDPQPCGRTFRNRTRQSFCVCAGCAPAPGQAVRLILICMRARYWEWRGSSGRGDRNLPAPPLAWTGGKAKSLWSATILPQQSVAAALQAGLCLVPENRKEHGLFLDFSIAANIALPNLAMISRRWAVDQKAEMALATAGRDRIGIRTNDLTRAAAELSGGNQQKVVLAKWLALNPRCHYPGRADPRYRRWRQGRGLRLDARSSCRGRRDRG